MALPGEAQLADDGRAAPDARLLRDRLARLLSDNPADLFGVSGAVLAVAGPSGAITKVAAGTDAAGDSVDTDSIFPLASASKLALGLLILALVDEGALELDGELGRYLPDAAAAHHPDVTISRLLAHSSGLPLEIRHELSTPPGRIDWRSGLRWPGELAAACLHTELTTAPGAVFQYSNVGYGLLALAAERVTGQSTAALIQQRVALPLGIELFLGCETDRSPMALADVPGPYAGTPYDPYCSPAAMGIGFPWRGMFSNIQGLLELIWAYRDEGPVISAASARRARSDQSGQLSGGYLTTDAFLGIGESRRLVWERASWGLAVEVQGGKEPHWAPSWLPLSVGQIGSSGCLAWYDPDSGVAWAIAGARTTEKGWLVRHGARIARTALEAAGATPPGSGPPRPVGNRPDAIEVGDLPRGLGTRSAESG